LLSSSHNSYKERETGGVIPCPKNLYLPPSITQLGDLLALPRFDRSSFSLYQIYFSLSVLCLSLSFFASNGSASVAVQEKGGEFSLGR
jgi:hypothetical protein